MSKLITKIQNRLKENGIKKFFNNIILKIKELFKIG